MTNRDTSMQTSIGVEYWVVDQDGALTTPDALTEYSEYVEEEFVYPLIELKTPPCETHSALKYTFVEQLDELLTRANELDKTLVPLGTPINSRQIEARPSERSRIQKQVLWDNFAYAKYCAGTHLHFEKQNVTDQLNVLASLDPALGLLNSSPYFRGDSVASGARSYIYRKSVISTSRCTANSGSTSIPSGSGSDSLNGCLTRSKTHLSKREFGRTLSTPAFRHRMSCGHRSDFATRCQRSSGAHPTHRSQAKSSVSPRTLVA